MDKLGNRQSVTNRDSTADTYSANDINQYTQIIINSATKTPLYDAAGNLTKDINGYTYHYDYENRITSIKKNNDGLAMYIFTSLTSTKIMKQIGL